MSAPTTLDVDRVGGEHPLAGRGQIVHPIAAIGPSEPDALIAGAVIPAQPVNDRDGPMPLPRASISFDDLNKRTGRIVSIGEVLEELGL